MTLNRANTPSTIGTLWSPSIVGQRTFWFAVISKSSKPSSNSVTIEMLLSRDTFLLDMGDVDAFLRSNEERIKVDFPAAGAPTTARVTSWISPALAPVSASSLFFRQGQGISTWPLLPERRAYMAGSLEIGAESGPESLDPYSAG